MLSYEKPSKTERVTIRLTEETKSFIETFNGSEGEKRFAVAFQNMIDLFSGDKTKKLKEEVKRLENRITYLKKEESEMYNDVNRKMQDALWKLNDVQRTVNNLHSAVVDKNQEG